MAYVDYLGDGVHVHFDGHNGVVLATLDGEDVTNEIYLELDVLKKFEDYAAQLRAECKRKPAFGGQIPRYSPTSSLCSINLQDSQLKKRRAKSASA